MKCPSLTEILAFALPAAAACGMGWFLTAGTSGHDPALVRARDDLRALRSALLIEPNMPDTQKGLQHLVNRGTIPFLPQDPWGRPYQYRNPGKAYAWELFSLGPDGVENENGSGDDVDIWNLYPMRKTSGK
ncbi:MAG: type II secretion system protein GspG [Azoarcus sp.]|jgi:general secretion pathway protein G|nr:type II secretion system protein GspG [Azoarcus sp.]